MLFRKPNLISRARRLVAILCATVFSLAGCRQTAPVERIAERAPPPKILWAWERAEDLRFLDAQRFGVAFLAQTLVLRNGETLRQPRRQSLQVAQNVYLIAVTRVETDRKNTNRTDLSAAQKEKVVTLIEKTLELPNVRAVQIDFDALVSERDFYRAVVNDLKKRLPKNTPLTMTALASWCVGDAWFADFPVDEAVPMAFEMGADGKRIRDFLSAGRDWRAPLCRNSYGVAVDEPLPDAAFQPNRRFFYFKSSAWEKSDLDKLD